MNSLPPENKPSNSPAESDSVIYELSKLTFMALPYVQGTDLQYRIVNAVKMARFVWAEVERQCRTPERKYKDLQFGLEHFHHKTLVDPQDPNDTSTALGYLRRAHNLTRYKTADGLREALLKHGIPIQAKVSFVTDAISGESIMLGENVIQSDLDRFVKLLRAERSADQQARRDREN
jgi:hypothetical protein